MSPLKLIIFARDVMSKEYHISNHHIQDVYAGLTGCTVNLFFFHVAGSKDHNQEADRHSFRYWISPRLDSAVILSNLPYFIVL